jgi:hypothetical protein
MTMFLKSTDQILRPRSLQGISVPLSCALDRCCENVLIHSATVSKIQPRNMGLSRAIWHLGRLFLPIVWLALHLGLLDHRQRQRFDGRMWRSTMAALLCLLAGQAVAACGDKGGPGYRAPSGRCVGWADIGKTCGNPPSTRCTAERAASGAETAADLGQKTWDAGKDARKAAGRSD